MRGRTWWPVVCVVLLFASWSVSGDRIGRPSQDSAESSETGREPLPATVDQEVLFGEYECHADPGVSISVTAIFSSTGDLVPPHTQSVGVDGTVYSFAPLKVVNHLVGDATFARCESLASELERLLQEAGCTVGDRDGHSAPDASSGFGFVCHGPRPRLAHVIGVVGRSALGATL